jgi:hypothetical protein
VLAIPVVVIGMFFMDMPCPLIIGDSIDPICKLLYVFGFIELVVWHFSAYILQHRNRIGL